MRKTAVATLVACAIGVATGPAGASHSQYTGECTVRAFEDRTGQIAPPEVMTGRFHAEIDAYEPGTPNTPVEAEVTCLVKVNGVFQNDTATARGTGRIVVDELTQWPMQPGDELRVCTMVVFFNGTPQPDHTCSQPLGDYSAILGSVTVDGTSSPPTYAVHGHLANPNDWTCSDNGAATPYTVTCLPTMSIMFDWHCEVPRGDVTALLPATTSRATLDCDGAAPLEATAVATGPADLGSGGGPSGVRARRFVCTVDDGAGGAAATGFVAECGDPGQ